MISPSIRVLIAAFEAEGARYLRLEAVPADRAPDWAAAPRFPIVFPRRSSCAGAGSAMRGVGPLVPNAKPIPDSPVCGGRITARSEWLIDSRLCS